MCVQIKIQKESFRLDKKKRTNTPTRANTGAI